MTTAPTNEILALADELDAKLPVFHGRERDLIVRVVTALRLAATPARDVREAIGLLHTYAINFAHGLNIGQSKRHALTKIDEAVRALSNLDADAPAAGGVELPRTPTSEMIDAGLYHCSADMTSADLITAWQAMFDSVVLDGGVTDSLPASTNSGSVKPCGYLYELDGSMDETFSRERKSEYMRNEPWTETVLYATPPLQAPAHSDAVRGYTLLVELLGEYARDLRRNSSGGDDYPWDWASAVADQLDMLIQRSQFTQDDFYRTDETLSEHDRAKIEELVASYETPNPVAKVINNNKPGNTSIIEVLKTPPTLDVGTLLYAVPVRKTSHISYAQAAKAPAVSEADVGRDSDGKCRWTDVANAQTKIRATLRCQTISLPGSSRDEVLEDSLSEDHVAELEALAQTTAAVIGPSFIHRMNWPEYSILVQRSFVTWGPPPGDFSDDFASVELTSMGRAYLAARIVKSGVAK